MRTFQNTFAATILMAAIACDTGTPGGTPAATSALSADSTGIAANDTARAVTIPDTPNECHLTNVRQITFGGENAEAYFSPDGEWLTFQSTRDGRACDQQYVMRVDGTGPTPMIRAATPPAAPASRRARGSRPNSCTISAEASSRAAAQDALRHRAAVGAAGRHGGDCRAQVLVWDWSARVPSGLHRPIPPLAWPRGPGAQLLTRPR